MKHERFELTKEEASAFGLVNYGKRGAILSNAPGDREIRKMAALRACRFMFDRMEEVDRYALAKRLKCTPQDAGDFLTALRHDGYLSTRTQEYMAKDGWKLTDAGWEVTGGKPFWVAAKDDVFEVVHV